MLDDTLVTSFMSGFYGYGSYSADYWFVGMEEGGPVVRRRSYPIWSTGIAEVATSSKT